MDSGVGGMLAACRRHGGGISAAASRLCFLVVPGLEVCWFLDFSGRGFCFSEAVGANCLRFRLADLPIIGHTHERLSGFP